MINALRENDSSHMRLEERGLDIDGSKQTMINTLRENDSSQEF